MTSQFADLQFRRCDHVVNEVDEELLGIHVVIRGQDRRITSEVLKTSRTRNYRRAVAAELAPTEGGDDHAY